MEYKTKRGMIYIDRPGDAGQSPFKSQSPPAQKQADRIAKYLPRTPTGSQADVQAKGRHANGRWTLELARKLDTGHADDAKLVIGQAYRCAIAVFDRESNEDHRSSREFLVRLDP